MRELPLWRGLLMAVVLGAILLRIAAATAADVAVGDAYVRSEADGARWRIGSQGVEQVLECSNGQLLLTSCKNKLTQPATEYVSPQNALAPFALDVRSSVGRYSFQNVWNKSLDKQSTLDPAADNVAVEVKAGQMLGFCVLAASDAVRDCVEWTTKVTYENGPSFISSDDAKLAQGPVWFYYQIATGAGCLEELGETASVDIGGAKVPSRVATGYRAPFDAQGVGATHYSLRNSYTLVRAWKAPHDGKVTVSGKAVLKSGYLNICDQRTLMSGRPSKISIVRIADVAKSPPSLPRDFNSWKLEHAEANQVSAGGRPAVQLSMLLLRGSLRARMRIVAYPGTPVLRQWVTLANTGETPISLPSPAPLILGIDNKDAACYTNYWLDGGTSRPNQGVLQQSPMGQSYHRSLLGERSDNLVPWTAWQRKDGPADGCFVALDYLGTWNISVDCVPKGPGIVSVSLPTLADYQLAPGKTLELPVTTTGVFHRNLDDMGVHLYDWQYQYMWDHTNTDYYALSKWAVGWFACARNLQEQFTAKIAQLNMDADVMREMGFDMLWHDAGWAKYPNWPVPDNYSTVFTPSYEGPDFSSTLRYLQETGMKYILWFVGRPSQGIMDTKVASWGNFQWRTDGVDHCDWEADRAFRDKVETFLKNNPRSSFHTCCGGSRYAHQFEIMRLGDVHFLADGGRGPELNYFLSYLETPDKWVDVIDPMTNAGKYNPDTCKQMLTMTPFWGFASKREDWDSFRQVNQLYDYLKREGVAGRWSRVFHPKVVGDNPIYYFQRSNYDRTKACIILKHRSPTPVTVYPVELLPELSYVVGLDSTTETTTRTGAGLMEYGIALKDQKPGELIYLGLPDRPGSGNDKTPPQAPGRVLTRYETNIGHSGVGVHWSPGSDDRCVGSYEVRRNGKPLGKTAKGTYYFDHSEGWDPKAKYEVRTVDGDGNPSGWAAASLCDGQPLTAWALGGHFARAGRDGWKAEATDDGKTFTPMNWVPPARDPAGDFGGTPNQLGGVEGYWEAKGGARVGRGWQQAASDTACVRTWIAPESGQLRIVGRAMKEFFRQTRGTALRVRIAANDRVVWPAGGGWADVPLGDLRGATHDLRLDVKAGDAVRFILDRAADPADATLAWTPKIIYNSETPPAVPGSVVRILCGADKPYIDRNGNVWSADRYFSGGAPLTTDATIDGATPTSEDQPLYQFGRAGKEFSYSIPVKPGLYTIRLKFAESQYRWSFERPFNLSVNGREVMHNIDVCHVAKGPRRAHERVFRFLVPDEDRKLVLKFTGGFEPLQKSHMAMVQAIEVLPETKASLRIDCGSQTDFVDWNSSIWAADHEGEGGACIESQKAILQASPTLYDQQLYQTARAGKEIRYSLTVPPGLYAVHLKFAELWLPEKGNRPMTIDINGQRVRQRWDPGTAAGECGMAADVRVEDVAPNAAGQILIGIRAEGANDAILQGIEIE